MSQLTKLVPEAEGTALRYRGSALRALHTPRWDIAFECADKVWVTVELSAAFKVRGRASGEVVDRVGAFGGVSVNPPDQPLDLSIAGDYRALQVAVPVRLARAAAAEDHGLDAGRVEFRVRQGQTDRKLAKLLCRAATTWDEDDEEGQLREVVTHLLLEHTASDGNRISLRRAGITPAQLRRVKDFVEANLSTVTVAAMAAEAGLSPFHFAREFKRTAGETPWSYVSARRLGRAFQFLGEFDRPLWDVAHAAGFADASHLAHRMRERMGCSPTEARLHLLA